MSFFSKNFSILVKRVKVYLYNSVGIIKNQRIITTKEICENAVIKRETRITNNIMKCAVDLFFKEMAYQLCRGHSIDTEYFIITVQNPKILANTEFDSKENNILFKFIPGNKLKEEILIARNVYPHILSVRDIHTGSINDIITPGKNLQIIGSNLMIRGNNYQIGVFFIETGTQMRLPVETSDLIMNSPSELIIEVPDLPSGTYKLEISTQSIENIFTGELKVSLLDKLLTVQ